jgi:hypothetical protein
LAQPAWAFARLVHAAAFSFVDDRNVSAPAKLMLLPFAALLINLSLAKNPGWVRARRVLLWTAGLPLFGFGAFVFYSAFFLFPMGPAVYGPGVNIGWPPRFAFFTYMLWLMTLAMQAI